MEAFTEHWRQLPSFRYVVDIQVPEEATRIAMLRNGETDIAFPVSTGRLLKMMDEGWRAE